MAVGRNGSLNVTHYRFRLWRRFPLAPSIQLCRSEGVDTEHGCRSPYKGEKLRRGTTEHRYQAFTLAGTSSADAKVVPSPRVIQAHTCIIEARENRFGLVSGGLFVGRAPRGLTWHDLWGEGDRPGWEALRPGVSLIHQSRRQIQPLAFPLH